jgi:mono/diheme cytochrome c family protein
MIAADAVVLDGRCTHESSMEYVSLPSCNQASGGAAGMIQVSGLVMVALAHALMCLPATAQDFAPEQIRLGAEIFARNCSPCHGPRMQDPEGAFDLRTFPPEQHTRFVNSVSHGKNSMPPWSGLLTAGEIEALWAYVMAGEK